MAFQEEKGTIRWKMHFISPGDKVYEALATDSGRAGFWAESAVEKEGVIEFRFMDYPAHYSKVLIKEPNEKFSVEYFGSVVTFELESDGKGGTDLSLLAENVDESVRMEMASGWVSVLMAMKGAVDFGVDLRNHDPERSWPRGFADN